MTATRTRVDRGWIFARAVAAILGVTLATATGLPAAFARTAGTRVGSPTMYAWGDNEFGALGDGSTVSETRPVRVHLPAGARVVATAAGFEYSLALTSTGRVLGWGLDGRGELGDGSGPGVGHLLPVFAQFPPGVRIVAIAAGVDHALALTSTGEVFGWGRNSYGQVGDGTRKTRYVPVPVHLPNGVRAVGIAAGNVDSAAVTADGRELAWGNNYDHALGTGGVHHAPAWVDLPAGVRVVNTAVGQGFMLATTTQGTVLGWGYNGDGELGNGTLTPNRRPAPVAIPPGVAVRAVAAGLAQGYALTTDGSLFAWGDNFSGQLGDGTHDSRTRPVEVHLPANTIVTAVSTGSESAAAVTSTGRVLTWGDNLFGALGNGNHDASPIPTVVPLPDNTSVTAVAAGGTHTVVVGGP